MSLFNCLGKLCEKVVAEMFFEWCEVNHLLHDGQMGFKRRRTAIYAVARLVGRVQEALAEGRLAGMLLMDIKRAFDHVSQSYLVRTMDDMGADGDLMGGTESFMSYKRVGRVIDGH